MSFSIKSTSKYVGYQQPPPPPPKLPSDLSSRAPQPLASKVSQGSAVGYAVRNTSALREDSA